MQPIIFSAPANAMLLGEHAVLHGYPAVVAALNRRITVKLSPRKDDKIFIHSHLGNYQGDKNHLKIEKPWQFILAILTRYAKALPSGLDLAIEAKFSEQVGLGSSAAITAATLAAVHQWLNYSGELAELHQIGWQIIQQIQGAGSGADLTASLYGGTILYQTQNTLPREMSSGTGMPVPYNNNIIAVIKKLSFNPPITLVYCGYKTPTSEVIKHVQQLQAQNPVVYEIIFNAIGAAATAGSEAIEQHDLNKLAQAFAENYRLQQKLQVDDPKLQQLINEAKQAPNILGAKISGSGLGDCIVTLGKLSPNYFPRNEIERQQGVQQIDVEISDEGLK